MKEQLRYSKDLGDAAEEMFVCLLAFWYLYQGREVNIRKSTEREDKYDHIDYFINNQSYDVKAKRHLETIWLEKTNILGYKGWLQGKADYIAFDILELNAFSVYRRHELFDFIKDINEYTTDKSEHYKIYTRSKWGKKDELIKVKYDDIKHLERLKLPYESD